MHKIIILIVRQSSISHQAVVKQSDTHQKLNRCPRLLNNRSPKATVCIRTKKYYILICTTIRSFEYNFKPAYQISAVQLNRQKSQEKCALCAPCALLCTTVHHCTPGFFQNMMYKKVYEIIIQVCIPNFSSLD